MDAVAFCLWPYAVSRLPYASPVKIIHHERKRLASHFSIERLFAEIRRHMPADCEVMSCPAPEASAGILPRWRNVRHAARQTADVHHIVGDSHYLAFGLPPEKTVLTIHDCGALNRLTGWKRALLKYFWFTGPMRRAAVVTTISQASKDELRKWVGALADKVVVVPDCVFGEFAYDPKPFNEECPVVLQVGTKWNKNVERVMEAVREAGCRLEIVGTMEQGTGDRGQGTGGGRQEAGGIRHEEGVCPEAVSPSLGSVGRCCGVSEETRREEGASVFRNGGVSENTKNEEEWPRRTGGREAGDSPKATARGREEDLRLTNLKLKDSGETGDRGQEAGPVEYASRIPRAKRA